MPGATYWHSPVFFFGTIRIGPSVSSLLCSRLEVKESDGNCQLLLFSKVHEDWNHSSVIGRNAAIIAKENLRIAGKRRLIDLVVDEGSSAIDAARQREPCQRAFSVSSIIKDNVY